MFLIVLFLMNVDRWGDFYAQFLEPIFPICCEENEGCP